MTEISSSTQQIGFWSAVLSTSFSIAYAVAQLGEWLGLLGSKGGPGSASTLLGLIVLLTPSLLLAPSFVVLMVSIHQVASPAEKIWSHIAVVFASLYATLVSLVYFVQLTFVVPRIAHGRTQGIEQFLFVPFDSLLYSVDLLGYSFMSLATLFAAKVFTSRGLERIVRLFLIANGLLLPFIALQTYFRPLIWVASLWAVTFPGSAGSLAVLFRRQPVDPSHGAAA